MAPERERESGSQAPNHHKLPFWITGPGSEQPRTCVLSLIFMTGTASRAGNTRLEDGESYGPSKASLLQNPHGVRQVCSHGPFSCTQVYTSLQNSFVGVKIMRDTGIFLMLMLYKIPPILSTKTIESFQHRIDGSMNDSGRVRTEAASLGPNRPGAVSLDVYVLWQGDRLMCFLWPTETLCTPIIFME